MLFGLVDLTSAARHNYKTPVRDFSLTVDNGWPIYTDKHLSLFSPETEAKALTVLKSALKEVEEILPKSCTKLAKKKNLKFFIMYDKFDSREGMAYIRNNQSSWDKSVTKKMNISIIVHNPKDFIASKEGALHSTIHEVAHFYHLENYGASYEPIWRCFILTKEKYEGQYAGLNHMEYFAETSTWFFSNRLELTKNDPLTTEMLRHLWKEK